MSGTVKNQQSGQAIVEWALSAGVLLIFAFGILALAHVIDGYIAVHQAASEAAYAAARAPSDAAAQRAARTAAQDATAGRGLGALQIQISTHGFQRGGALDTSVSGCVDLLAFPFAPSYLGACVPLRGEAHALIEPYRSRASV